MTDIGTSAGRSAAFGGQRIAATLFGVQDAIDAAEAETRNSGLPGPDSGGPGNAYKHLLITGELYRRRGPTFEPMIAELRELANDAVGQTDEDADMDRTNNAIVVNERPGFSSWEDVVEWAGVKIVESAKHNGDGDSGRAAWYEKQPPDWRPDFTGLPITPLPKGPEPMAEPMGMADASGATGTGGPGKGEASPDPLDRPVASWSQGDVRVVLNSPAYLRSAHPQHKDAQRLVRLWFEQEFGTAQVALDAPGRIVRGQPGRRSERAASQGACPIPVRAHSRDGGRIRVRGHCRAEPA
jgi:hypothetical protein